VYFKSKKMGKTSPQTPTVLNNRYRVIKAISSGGFGETSLGRDTQMPSGRYCVIKQLKSTTNNPRLYQAVKERFQREAAILESLGENHNQIPRLYAYVSDEKGQFYLVQEWIEGETLAEKVKNSGPLNENSAKQILVDLLPVIDYIHGRGMIHRDIKPDNIILRATDNLPVLIDFGAVKESMETAREPGKIRPSIAIGTPGFMPIEQVAGRPVYASDLYSLGLTAIFLLTGKLPQDLPLNSETGELLWTQFAGNLSPSFVAILNRTIQPHAGDRFSSAEEMLAALTSMKTETAKPPELPLFTSSATLSPPVKKLPTTGFRLPSRKAILAIVAVFKQFKNQPKAVVLSGTVGGFFLFGILLNFLVKPLFSSSPNPPQATFPAPPGASSSLPVKNSSQPIIPVSPISQREAKQLINSWLKAKQSIFAPPYDVELANKLTAGSQYEEIAKRSLDWLQNNNAYYKYGTQVIEEVNGFWVSGDRAEITVTVTEDYQFYQDGKLNDRRGGKSTIKVLYNLQFVDGKWKIASSRII
jgi:serine/threonine-protein kinase